MRVSAVCQFDQNSGRTAVFGFYEYSHSRVSSRMGWGCAATTEEIDGHQAPSLVVALVVDAHQLVAILSEIKI